MKHCALLAAMAASGCFPITDTTGDQGDTTPGGDAIPYAYCGNEIVEPGELCDGGALEGEDCSELGDYYPTTPQCGSDCQSVDLGSCYFCGDGLFDPMFEDCEGTGFITSCLILGYGPGDLSCTAACEIDTSTCCQPDCSSTLCGPDPNCDELCDRCPGHGAVCREDSLTCFDAGAGSTLVDCAWVEGDNCWKAATAEALACLPDDPGTYNVDQTECTWATGETITFVEPPTWFNWNLTFDDALGPCGLFEAYLGNYYQLFVLETALGRVEAWAVDGSLFTLCPDGNTYELTSSEASTCAAGSVPGHGYSEHASATGFEASLRLKGTPDGEVTWWTCADP